MPTVPGASGEEPGAESERDEMRRMGSRNPTQGRRTRPLIVRGHRK